MKAKLMGGLFIVELVTGLTMLVIQGIGTCLEAKRWKKQAQIVGESAGVAYAREQEAIKEEKKNSKMADKKPN